MMLEAVDQSARERQLLEAPVVLFQLLFQRVHTQLLGLPCGRYPTLLNLSQIVSVYGRL